MPPDSEPTKDQTKPGAADADRAKVVSTEQLFAGEREIVIEHEGVRYRLRITRRNKLILQK
ncbi:MAG: hemin uptake protein HemP [Gemmataceae bacterium]|nr:hemin uptake protein HemP [Gemmataceae bacterium]